jgi:hypothetical protein
MKKIFSSILVLSSLLLAQDNLYKDYKAGDSVYKHIKNNEIEDRVIDCRELNIPLLELSKCYFIKDNENIGEEKEFTVFMSTINDKINTIHLLKVDQKSPLFSNVRFWNVMFNSNLKGYSSFNNLKEEFPNTSILQNNLDFKKEQHKIYNNAISLKESFTIDNVLLETKYNFGDNINFTNSIKDESLIRLVEILDSYDSIDNVWHYRIDITNIPNQLKLMKEFKELNGIKLDKI